MPALEREEAVAWIFGTDSLVLSFSCWFQTALMSVVDPRRAPTLGACERLHRPYRVPNLQGDSQHAFAYESWRLTSAAETWQECECKEVVVVTHGLGRRSRPSSR